MNKKLGHTKTAMLGEQHSSPVFVEKVTWFFAGVVLAIVMVGMFGCTSQPPPETNVEAEQPQTEDEVDNSLTLDDVTLEQANEQGQLLWRVQSKQASYSRDNRVAKVIQPAGELFREGKLLYKVEAQQGEVYQDSKRIVLRDQIVVTDVERELVLRGNQLEWIVDQEILVMRNGVSGEHKQGKVAASEIQVFNKEQRMELWNKVVITANNPVVQVRSDHVIWQWDQEKLISKQKVEIDRYQDQTITDRGVAGEAEVDLNTQVTTLKQNVQIALSQPPLQIASNEIKWNYQDQTIASPQPLTLIHREEQVTFTANQGYGNLEQERFDLTGNVVAIGQKRQAQLNTDQVTWYVGQQQFEAQGNVVYRQMDPPLSLSGQTAQGELMSETIVISGGDGNQVVTEFVP